ncbi:MAG: enoyl-CoA hydratase/isomerase family protein [Proteobacteria bacterium]|nr:enoyl-CoA hydratase/isomerase family protein [Pseudomonadota bacterium]
MKRVLLEKPREHVSVVRFNEPDRMNPMNFAMVEDLYGVLAEVSGDNDCKVVILTGAGAGFCSGMDLDDTGLPPGSDGLPMSRIATLAMDYMAGIVPALKGLRQPVVGAINGPAVGGGFCVALGCDIRVAATSSCFRGAGIINGLTGTELGISWLLPRIVGLSRANEILLTGRKVSAEEAERIGLVSRVVEDGALMDSCLDMAAAICELSTHGVAMTKKVLWSNLETSSLDAAIEMESRNQLLVRLTTNNLAEFLKARSEGRKPVYED